MRVPLLNLALWSLLLGAPAAHAQGLGPLERVPGVTGEVVSLDVDPATGRWAVLFADGSVRVRNPGGADWILRAPRETSDEADDAILRVENFLGDLEDADEGDFDTIDVGEDVEDDVPDDVDDVGGETNDQLEELLQGETSLAPGSGTAGANGFVRWGLDGRIAVSRADGVWTADDGGRRWGRISKDPAADLADTGSTWVALMPEGELLIDGVRTDLYLGPLILEVADLAASDGTVWAATDVGLWAYRDGSWGPSGDDLEGLRQVFADPGWEGGLWAVGRDGVLRTDDAGQSWRLLEDGPRRGEMHWGGPAPGGALYVVARDGVWEYRDQGWLRDGRQLDLAVGSADGPYAIAEGVLLGPPGPGAAEGDLPQWIPLGDLMYSALSRRELSESMKAGRLAQTLMPEVTIEGMYSPDSATDYLPFTTADTGRELRLLVRAKWTPAGRSAAGDAFQETIDEVALRTGFDDLGIAGDRGVLGAMGGSVGRRATDYRSRLSVEIRDLYAARNALFFERDALPPDNLAAEVVWELRRAEIEAQLDALTGGAVSSYTQDSTNATN